MAFWIFKCNPERYRLSERLTDSSPILTWTVTRFREDIQVGDTVFLWETGENRGIRAVLRVDQPPRDIPELDSEQQYWAEPDQSVSCRIVGILTHRGIDLTSERLRQVPGLENLSVFKGYQQATNFPVSPSEGAILLDLVERQFGAEDSPGPIPSMTTPGSIPAFEKGRLYDRRADIHARYGGQNQGGISTPVRFPCIFLFTSPSGQQHGYQDGWDESGVFLYTGEGQAGDMEFVRGNLAIRDHASSGRDLHLFESLGKGEGYRYLGLFDCAGWEYRRGPDTQGNDRRLIVFHLVPEEAEVTVNETQKPGELEDLRRKAFESVSPQGERPPRESRRTYYERSAAVRAYVLARASGICEACRKAAPFLRVDGSPYLEPHHTRRIADGGPDHPRWVGAICPNCHSEIHFGAEGSAKNMALQDYLKAIESAGL